MSDLLDRITELSPEKRKLVELLLQREAQSHKEPPAGAATAAPAPATAPIVALPRDGHPLPLSPAQQRLWFLDQLSPGDPFYNIATATRLSGRLDASALAGAFNTILARHEALRTIFPSQDGPQGTQPAPAALPTLVLELPLVDLSELPEQDREARSEELIRAEAAQPFDLAHGPLIRASLLRLAPQEHILAVTMHHIIADGWSTGILMRELGALYTAAVSGQPAPLAPLPIQYADYAHWQTQRLQSGLEGQLDYWRNRLAGLPALNLPADRPRSITHGITFRGNTHQFALPATLAAELKALSQREGVTLFMTLLAAFDLLLAGYSGQEDFAVGTPIAGRRREELEGLIGFFNSMLVLRADLAGAPTLRELLQRTRETALAAYANQDVPFERLVEEVQTRRDLSRTPLFQVMFALQNVPLPTLELPELTLRPIGSHDQAAKFDLSLALKDLPEGITGVLRYNADLFDEASAARLLDRFAALLEAVASADPARPAAELLPLTEEDRAWIARGQATSADAPREWIAPRNAVETVLADIWSNVLGVERVGVTDNFFDLGGHSLKAAQLFSRVRETFRVNLPLRRLFEATTVEALAGIIVAHEARPGQTEKIAQVLMRIRGMSPEERQNALTRQGGDHA
ncbi:MAG: hypothetical protein OHK0022_60140 [Roseiflexaceae bacterium]